MTATPRTLTQILTVSAALVVFAVPAAADSALPLVTSTAIASWTDANANTYAPVTAQAVIEIGVDARPIVSVVKEAYRADQVTPLAAGGDVLPGEVVQYKITVANTGAVAASNLHLDELLPNQVSFESTSGDAAGWTITSAGNAVDADLAGTLAPSDSRFFWVSVRVN